MIRKRDTAWFHEDDYCQIELLPRDAADFTRRQAAEIDAFAAAHDDNGMGWTDMYIRPDAPTTLRDLHISVAALSECIPTYMFRFPTVTTGYSSHVEPAPRTVAWGDGQSPLILADFDERGEVQYVWFSPFGEDGVVAVRHFVSSCAERWPLILADWAWSRVVDLSDEAACSKYLSLRAAPES